jgi:putative membrane protein insertion efficiency factor
MSKISSKQIKIGESLFEISAFEKDSAIVERYFSKHTKLDLEIQNLQIPKKPVWLNLVVRSLRHYQRKISPKLGNRCVFDPSCSRYSELAYREKGFFKGSLLTLNRLSRCRPSNGGKDILN